MNGAMANAYYMQSGCPVSIARAISVYTALKAKCDKHLEVEQKQRAKFRAEVRATSLHVTSCLQDTVMQGCRAPPIPPHPPPELGQH